MRADAALRFNSSAFYHTCRRRDYLGLPWMRNYYRTTSVSTLHLVIPAGRLPAYLPYKYTMPTCLLPLPACVYLSPRLLSYSLSTYSCLHADCAKEPH